MNNIEKEVKHTLKKRPDQEETFWIGPDSANTHYNATFNTPGIILLVLLMEEIHQQPPDMYETL